MEIVVVSDAGLTVDFFAYNSSGQVWNGSAYVALTDDISLYRITATEQPAANTFGRYSGTLPSDAVTFELRERGATAALSFPRVVGETATLAAIEAKTGLITNGSVRTWPVVSAFGSIVNIASPVGQVAPITIPSGDYQALTLEVVWEEEGECLDGGTITNVATVANANITKAANSITFAIPAAVAAQKQTLIYSVRDTVNGRLELIGGTWTVRPAAN
jgi:hypothetical protein